VMTAVGLGTLSSAAPHRESEDEYITAGDPTRVGPITCGPVFSPHESGMSRPHGVGSFDAATCSTR